MFTVYTIDAFTDSAFKGNPAGVCILDAPISKELMQNIAAELNYSNTAFVQNVGPLEYNISWFTPVSEAPLCGHATIGAIYVLCDVLHVVKENDTVQFNSMSGKLEARKEDGWYILNFPRYEVSYGLEVEAIKGCMNIAPHSVEYCHNCYIADMNSLSDLLALTPDLEKLKLIDCRALIATCKGENGFDFHSRYFAPSVGINEDPVCASAHSRLIPYWSLRLNKSEMLAHQASKRGGILRCKDLQNRVLISGQAVLVMKSELYS